jgi:hypothetical protein
MLSGKNPFGHQCSFDMRFMRSWHSISMGAAQARVADAVGALLVKIALVVMAAIVVRAEDWRSKNIRISKKIPEQK